MCDNVAANQGAPVCYLAARRATYGPHRLQLDGPFRRAKHGPSQMRKPVYNTLEELNRSETLAVLPACVTLEGLGRPEALANVSVDENDACFINRHASHELFRSFDFSLFILLPLKLLVPTVSSSSVFPSC